MLEAELYTGHLEVHQTWHSRISFFLFASTFLIFCMEQKSVQWSLKILDFYFFIFCKSKRINHVVLSEQYETI